MAAICKMGDAMLHEHDVRLLRPGRWLNDQLIAYYFAYIAQQLPDSPFLSFA